MVMPSPGASQPWASVITQRLRGHLAERACGETDWLDPPGMPRPYRRLWRRPLASNPCRLHRLLQQGLRTPTGLAFVSFCIDGIRGLAFAFASMGRSTRPVVLVSGAP